MPRWKWSIGVSARSGRSSNGSQTWLSCVIKSAMSRSELTSRPSSRAPASSMLNSSTSRQVELVIEEAFDVAGVGISRHKFVQVGCVLVLLPMTIAPGQQLEDGESWQGGDFNHQVFRHGQSDSRAKGILESCDVQNHVSFRSNPPKHVCSRASGPPSRRSESCLRRSTPP